MEVAQAPSEHIFAHHFLHRSVESSLSPQRTHFCPSLFMSGLLKLAHPPAGKQIFVSLFAPGLPEVVLASGEHICVRNFVCPDY